MGMGWEACSNKKGWKLIESGLGVLIIAGGQTIGGKLAEAIAGSKGNANTNIQPGSKQPVQIEKLNQKQENAIRKIDNSIKNGLKYHDIAGSLKDMDGNPVPKPGGGYWDHLQEMQNTLRGLRRNAETLKTSIIQKLKQHIEEQQMLSIKLNQLYKGMAYDYFPYNYWEHQCRQGI